MDCLEMKNNNYAKYILSIILFSMVIILSGCNTDPTDNSMNENVLLNNVSPSENSNTNNELPVTENAVNNELNDKIIVGHTDTDVSKIPSCWIEKSKRELRIAYAHTSHGSQISSGMEALQKYNNIYSYNSAGDNGALHFEDYYGGYNGAADLSAGETTWYQATRKFLDDNKNQDINVIMWSWCSIAGHDIEQNYISNMKKLIAEYGKGSKNHPTPVKFVLMTGHAEGQGINDASDSRNKLIREFCNELDNCILFDFADIENYDPDGNYYLDKRITDNLQYDCKSPYNTGSQDCNWAEEYLDKHPNSVNSKLSNMISGCAHSQSLTCALKGQAAWSLWARMVGWNGKDQTCE